MKPISLLLALPLLGACATAASSPPNLNGTDWRFTAIDGATPVGKRATLTFETDRLGANVGCNGLGGGWRLEGERLITDGIIGTMMFCEGVMAQERAVSELLGGRPTVTISGNRLTLRSDRHTAVLVRS